MNEETYDLPMAPILWKVVLKSVTTMFGVQCVIMDGELLMLMWHAGSWVSQDSVRKLVVCCCFSVIISLLYDDSCNFTRFMIFKSFSCSISYL